MAKTNTPVSAAKILALLNEKGVPYTELAGFYRVAGAEDQYRIYIPKSKTFVKHIDFSGFEVEFGAIPNPDKNGKVKQILDMRPPLTEDDILANLSAIVDHMLLLAPVKKEEKKKEPKAKKAASPPAEAAPLPDSSPADLEAKKKEEAERDAKRMALIMKVAAEKGVAVSPKANVVQAQAALDV